MSKICVLLLFSLIININCSIPEHNLTSVFMADLGDNLGGKDGWLGEAIGLITNPARMTADFLNTIAYYMRYNEKLYDTFMLPFKKMLNFLTPRFEIDSIINSFKRTDDCLEPSIVADLDDIARLLTKPTRVFKDLFKAFWAYTMSAGRTIGVGLVYDKDFPGTVAILKAVLMNLGAYQYEFSQYSMKPLRSFIIYLENLQKLSETAFDGLLTSISTLTFKNFFLSADIADILMKLKIFVKTSDLSRIVTAELSRIEVWFEEQEKDMDRKIKQLNAKNEELAKKRTELTGKLASAPDADKPAIQKEIDEVNSKINKNKLIISTLQELKAMAAQNYRKIVNRT